MDRVRTVDLRTRTHQGTGKRSLTGVNNVRPKAPKKEP